MNTTVALTTGELTLTTGESTLTTGELTLTTGELTLTTGELTVAFPDGREANKYRLVLLAINCVVLLCGSVSLSLMMHILKSSTASITSIAVLNLIFAHFVFLLTVPFRIYYYVGQSWSLGLGWCKVVSSMIHIHMYMSFIFYVIILITRLMTFHRKRLAPVRRVYAFLFSAALWLVGLVAVPIVICLSYGKNKEAAAAAHESACFNFGRHIDDGAKVVNYVVSSVIVAVACTLTGLQAKVLVALHRQGTAPQQDFGAQLKSLCFALIMAVCFVPYHLFRFYYVQHIELEHINEVFLSMTTFSCLDMLTFLGRRSCDACCRWRI